MATTFSGLSEAQLDDNVIAEAKAILPFLAAFSTRLDFAGEALPVKDDTRKVMLVTDVTIGNKTPGMDTDGSGSVTGVNVTLDQFLSGAFDAIEGTISRRGMTAYFKKMLPRAANCLARKMVNEALGKVKAATFTNATTIDFSAFDTDTLTDIRAAAKAHIKDPFAMLLAGTKLAAKISGLAPVMYTYGLNGSNIIADNGLPGKLIGFNAFEYDDLPNNGEQLEGVIIHPSAIAVAASAPDQLIESGQGDVAYRRIITEPESGLSLQYTESVMGKGVIHCELASLFGAATGVAAGAHRIVTAGA